mgnify:FL=1
MIEIRNCSKAFGEIHAIDHVLMEIGERQIFGLVGTNGAGKSTLLRMAAGVIKPDEGEILVDQEPVYENEKIKQQIFYISDGGYFPQGYTAADLKDFYREYYPDFMTDRYSKLMDQFHLDEKRRISSYSKGMKKQLLVIMGISAGTKYLLCDETFDGLDPVMRQAVKSLFVSEIMNRDFAPVIASHNMRELEDVCDHVGLLHKGGILLSRELEDMKFHIHKIQCVLKEGMTADDLKGLQILSQEGRGRLLTLTVRGTKQEAEDIMNRYEPVFFECIPLSLEEIFISETEVAGYDIRKLIF